MKKSDLISATHIALLGCVTPALRMLKVLFSEIEHQIFVVAYFDCVPKVYEQELISDISGEIECSLTDVSYTCRSVCVHATDRVIGNTSVEQLESKICGSILFSEVCYLRFGEEGGYEDVTFEGYEELEQSKFYQL